MNTNDPTTGEIVRALRYCVGKDTICGTACPAYLSEAGCRTTIMKNAADRLESQEQKIEELTVACETIHQENQAMIDCHKPNLDKIAALTARAEQAKKERDEVEKSLARRIMQHLSDYEFDSTFVCEICEYNLTNSPKCLSCGSDHHHGKNFELKHILRGLPQDGEGK